MRDLRGRRFDGNALPARAGAARVLTAMSFGFPVTPVDVALSADAIEIPKGHPAPILYIGGTFAPARRLDPRSLPPIKVKVSRDGKVTEFEIRPAGTESRVNDERHLAPTQTSGDGREAASLVARILITVDKAVDHAHVPPHVGG